ncbi:serine hydrolase [Pseudomonas entomophila]|uniref:serine hydrolase domain-containing protein n=1 Tax=Pseudomonas entomophila TaxID=312306 RepID=UPI0023D87E27|nr:serine hydrolase [Pseudomonas entomophila]MDF0731361.1 serine hydrolase [Pseudomonas entomophila]
MPESNAFDLPTAAPSTLGIDGHAVADFLEAVQEAGLEVHGVMIERDGLLAVDAWRWPYNAHTPRVTHSITKSFAACAIGLAIDDGLLRLNDPLSRFFPEAAARASDPRSAGITVEQLLTMRTGHGGNTSGSVWRGIDGSWVEEFFRIPLVSEPGTAFVYTSAASYMLSAILTQVTGQTLHQYLTPRLFQPLGFAGESWDISPDGINPGGNGLTARPLDVLKLAMLHREGGRWQGRQLLSAEWVSAATRPQGGEGSRYGYHWWTDRPANGYSAVGVFAQLAAVIPGERATLAVFGAMEKSAVVTPYIDRHLGAALRGERAGAQADERLRQTIERFAAPRPLRSSARPTAPLPALLSYALEANPYGLERLNLRQQADRLVLELVDETGTHAIEVGLDQWLSGTCSMPGAQLHHGYSLRDAPVIAGAHWVSADRLEMEWIYPRSAFRDVLQLAFEGARVRVERRVNINSGVREWAPLLGARLA